MHFSCHELMVASETPDSPSLLTGTTGPYTRCQTQDQQGGLELSDPGGCPRGGVSQMASSIAPGTRRHPRLCSPLLSSPGAGNRPASNSRLDRVPSSQHFCGSAPRMYARMRMRVLNSQETGRCKAVCSVQYPCPKSKRGPWSGLAGSKTSKNKNRSRK